MEVSFLKADDCDYGCVFGIEPQKTTYDEAYQILTENSREIDIGSIEKGDYFDHGLNKEVHYINFTFENTDYGCSISFLDNVVARIDVGGLYGRTKITTIHELIMHFGKPDTFFVIRKNPEGRMCFSNFFWKDLGIVAESMDEKLSFFDISLCGKIDKNDGMVPGNLYIDNIVLLSPDAFEAYFNGYHGNDWIGLIEE